MPDEDRLVVLGVVGWVSPCASHRLRSDAGGVGKEEAGYARAYPPYDYDQALPTLIPVVRGPGC